MPGVDGNRLLTGFVVALLLLLPAGVSMADQPEKKAKVKAVFIGDDSAAFLGVQIEEETEYEEGGARVTSVVKGSPAEEAGLEDEDIIVGFDGDSAELRQLEASFILQVNEVVAESHDLAEYVREITEDERNMDPTRTGELVDEIEQFLKDV